MSTFEIVRICILGIAILAVLILILIKAIKNKWFSKLWDTVKIAIKEAEEKYPESGSGEQKKAYVLEKVKTKCDELGIPYNFLKKLINLTIDKVIKYYNVISK